MAVQFTGEAGRERSERKSTPATIKKSHPPKGGVGFFIALRGFHFDLDIGPSQYFDSLRPFSVCHQKTLRFQSRPLVLLVVFCYHNKIDNVVFNCSWQYCSLVRQYLSFLI